MDEQRFFVRGDIDIDTAPALQVDLDEFTGATDGDVVLDCCGVTFIDSTGVAVLVSTHATLEALGRNLRVVNVSHMTERVLELLGLTDILRINDPGRADSN